MSKNAFCLVIQNPLALRSTRMLSCILSVLFDKLSSESESSDVSILTSLQIILNEVRSGVSYLFMFNDDKSSFLT